MTIPVSQHRCSKERKSAQEHKAEGGRQKTEGGWWSFEFLVGDRGFLDADCTDFWGLGKSGKKVDFLGNGLQARGR